MSGSFTVLCAIIASVVLKYIVQNRKSAQRQPFRKSVTPRLRYKKNVSPETPVSRTGSAYPSPPDSTHTLAQRWANVVYFVGPTLAFNVGPTL